LVATVPFRRCIGLCFPSKSARVGAAVEQNILCVDVASMHTRQEGTALAEFFRLAETAGDLDLVPLLHDLGRRGVGKFRGLDGGIGQPTGLERSRQQVVDRYIVWRRLTREAGNEPGQARSRAI